MTLNYLIKAIVFIYRAMFQCMGEIISSFSHTRMDSFWLLPLDTLFRVGSWDRPGALCRLQPEHWFQQFCKYVRNHNLFQPEIVCSLRWIEAKPRCKKNRLFQSYLERTILVWMRGLWQATFLSPLGNMHCISIGDRTLNRQEIGGKVVQRYATPNEGAE